MDQIAPPQLDQETAISGILNSTTEAVYLLRPSPEIIAMFVRLATENPSSPVIHILATDGDLKDVRRQFPVASLAADLVLDSGLTLTASVPSGRGTLAITETDIYSISHVEDHLFVCEVDGKPTTLRETCEAIQDTETFDLRTPGWTRTVETLEETSSAEVRDDFAAAIAEMATTKKEAVVDEVMIALLIGAKHDLLLYDISRWVEDIQLCSRATLSRVKGQLENHDIIESTKVPIDVGRPRLRLTLAEPYSSSSVAGLIEKTNSTITD